jgi:hypothetical protein
LRGERGPRAEASTITLPSFCCASGSFFDARMMLRRACSGAVNCARFSSYTFRISAFRDDRRRDDLAHVAVEQIRFRGRAQVIRDADLRGEPARERIEHHQLLRDVGLEKPRLPPLFM